MLFWAGAACSYALLTAATVLFDTHHLSVEAVEASRVSVVPPELISSIIKISCLIVANRVVGPAMVAMPAYDSYAFI